MEENVLAKRIQGDIKIAMKAGDRLRLDTLRMLLSELKGAQIDEGELSVEREIAILSSSARRRKESIREYENAGREDLASKERAELEIVTAYLPAQMDEAAIEAAVRSIIVETGALGPADIGKVMGAIMSRHKGAVDGNLVKNVAMRLLRG
ncbi:MAG: GatB/YqeY domain-containing protein [Candidatus Krumholzibacteria bacterium]|nr:GatB/YqeY domain-containing protein [Candidatus Krumholzibacteria bacterium]